MQVSVGGRSSISAPTKKQSARRARWSSWRRPGRGSTRSRARRRTPPPRSPNNTQPARFTAAIRQSGPARGAVRPGRHAVGERAGDEEAGRAEQVGGPDQPVLLLRGQPVLHGVEGADVEQQGADELDRRAPPGRVLAPAAPRARRGLAQLEAGREREEDRAREEHDAVRPRARPAARSRGTAR